MTRQKHDQYSKQFVAELLEDQGELGVNVGWVEQHPD